MDTLKSTLDNSIKVQVNETNRELDTSLDREYIDNRKITISLIHNYSNYRKANMKVLGQRKETIGSSITSCRVLSSNSGEVEAYFPSIVGLSPNHQEFVSRVKSWLSNIQFVVANDYAELDISFIYKTKRDYLNFKKREETIDNAYSRIDRSNLKEIKEALKRKIDALNALESEKYTVGKPVNVVEYLIYRHCLLYKDVAKDIALINSDRSYRFYIKDEAKEAERKKKITQERLLAMRNFIELNASDSKFDSAFVMVALMRNDNLAESLLKAREEKTAIMMNFVNENPDKFNKLIKDANIATKAFIETLIIRGELIRSEFNQQISTSDGLFVGSNLNEAVAFFNNPTNKDVRTAFENKLKMF